MNKFIKYKKKYKTKYKSKYKTKYKSKYKGGSKSICNVLAHKKIKTKKSVTFNNKPSIKEIPNRYTRLTNENANANANANAT